MRERGAWIRAGSAAALLLAGGSLDAQSQCTPPGQPAGVDTGFNDVVFSSTSGTFSSVLPFDVPLRICADVPEGTTRASVTYAATPRRQGPLDVDPDSCTIRTPGVQWGPAYTRVPTGAAVRWLVGRLDAERYYAFCFRFEKQATPAEQQAFAKAARQALEAGIARLDTASLTAAQTQTICEELGTRLLAAAGADELVTKGTVFDCDPAQVGAFATKVNRGPLEKQRLARLILLGDATASPFPVPALSDMQNQLAAALTAIQGEPALAALLADDERLAAIDTAAAARAQSLCAGCPSLVGPAATPASRLALGEDATQPPAPPLTSTLDPAQATAMAQGYAALAKNLADLERLVTWAIGPQAPATLTTALSSAERSALALLVPPADTGPLALASGRATTLAEASRRVAAALAARTQGIDALADELTVVASTMLLADASTLGNFTTSQKSYVSLDAGMSWAPALEQVVPYLGTNIYFRPVNRNAPLASLGNFGQTFSRRFSLSFGVTASSIADNGSGNGGAARDDLFGSQSLLLGAGLRITDAMRLGAGAIVFEQKDPSPLIDEEKLNTSYYLSLSFDVDVVRLFSRTFGGWLNPPAGGG